MQDTMNYQIQLQNYGLNPNDWSIKTQHKSYVIFENKRSQGLEILALLKALKIQELQLISL